MRLLLAKLAKLFHKRKRLRVRPRYRLGFEILEDRWVPSTPTIVSISPIAGPLAGATLVTIAGTNLTGATEVDFGTNAVSASSFTSSSDSQIVLDSPAETAGSVDVKVVTPGGSFTDPHAFTFVSAPTVTGITPTFGGGNGGTTVTITGTNLNGATAVDFGTTLVTSFISDTANQMVVASPAGTGLAVVTVVTPGGTSTPIPAGQFQYQPAISSIVAASGPTTGGATVTISGADLAGATAVDFGTIPATIVSDTASQIVVTTPPEVAGLVDVRVTNADGTSATSPAVTYTFVAPPTVTAISPTFGGGNGGTTVTITGTNLSGATQVNFGPSLVTTFISDSDSQIVLSGPAGTGLVDVTVTTGGGTSATSSADQFQYHPTIISITPSSGTAAGGTTVTINGGDLAGATAVVFGTSAATIVSDTASRIVVTTPAEAAGPVDVRVTNADGTSATSAAVTYTFVAAPTVTGISPTFGGGNGGTTVTITGTNLSGATKVNFGTSSVTTFISDTDSQIVLSAPAGSGLDDVTVITPGGTSATSAADQFQYHPAVTSIVAASGPTTGGNTVTINGGDLSGASAVIFGTTSVTSFTTNTASQIVLVVPAGAAGPVDVKVTNADGTSATNPSTTYTYVSPLPPTPQLSVLEGNVSASDGVGISGVTITLTGATSGGTAVNLTTQTDGNGNYVFNQLQPGTYNLTRGSTSTYLAGAGTLGNLGGSSGVTSIGNITLQSGQVAMNYNFTVAYVTLQAVNLFDYLSLTPSMGSSRVDLQACKLEYSIVSPK